MALLVNVINSISEAQICIFTKLKARLYRRHQTIALEGTLPRKTFSLGEAEEKRYYVECRRIAP